jgi:hypothetical protein
MLIWIAQFEGKGMKVMRAVYLAALTSAATIGWMVSDGRPAAAQQYPWCLVVMSGNGDGGEFCYYTTLEQCRASIAGGGQFCSRNPAFSSGSGQPRGRRSQPR